MPARINLHPLNEILSKYTLFHMSERTLLRSDFSLEKSVTRAVIPPLSQKGTLGSPVHLQARSQRLTFAAAFLRDAPAAQIFRRFGFS